MEKKIDAKTLKEMRVDITEALKGITEKYGLEYLNAGDTKFSDGGEFHFKLDGMIKGGIGVDGERYVKFADQFGLPSLGTRIMTRNGSMVTAGLNGSGMKVHCKSEIDHKMYWVPVHFVADSRNHLSPLKSNAG